MSVYVNVNVNVYFEAVLVHLAIDLVSVRETKVLKVHWNGKIYYCYNQTSLYVKWIGACNLVWFHLD